MLTDRRILRLAMSPWNQSPAGLREDVGRSAVVSAGGGGHGTLGYRDVRLRRADGTTQILRVNRLWRDEAVHLVEALTPSDSRTPPPP